ncbi:MAG: hypothetical protein HDT33_08460 [Clostridiales bacterium]|nr:hypothetical protein [Clostridiales bacterium]
MMRSSIGFHTISLSMLLGKDSLQKLIKDFRTYSATTGLIKIFPVDGKAVTWDCQYQGDGTVEMDPIFQKNLKIVHCEESDKGIEWLLRYNSWGNDYKPYIVEVKINPKILSGISDYITAATYKDMPTAIANFNCESRKISSLLGDFSCYKINRVDYCANLYIPEVAPNCTPEQIMNLIQRSNIPRFFTERTERDPIAHRPKSDPNSFYLKNSCVHINCYYKTAEFQKRSKERERMGLSSIPQTTIDSSQGIIRFEIQCKYRKIYDFCKNTTPSWNQCCNKYKYLLADEICRETINHYWKETIGWAPWYSLQSAIGLIKLNHFNSQKEDRLIDVLKLVNQCRSVPSAKKKYWGDEASFNRTLKDLDKLRINPVTIPKNWGIGRIWNPLESSYSPTYLGFP